MHIKLKGMEHRAPHKHIFSYTHFRHLGSGHKVKPFFNLNVVMLHYIKLKGKNYRPTQ